MLAKAADVRRRPAEIAPEAAETLADAMLADELKAGLSEAIEIVRKPLTNAEKQARYRARQKALRAG